MLILSDIKLALVLSFSATAEDLALELPKCENKKCTILYPASAKASGEIGMLTLYIR